MQSQDLLPKTINFFKKGWVCGIIAIVVFACLVISGFLSSSFLPVASNNAITIGGNRLYFISLAKSENNLSLCQEEFMEIGAGGYIWQNGGYFHMISSCYEKENDALLVQSKIKQSNNLESEIFYVDFPLLNISNDERVEGKKVLTKALKSFFATYQELFDIAISLDTSVYNEISARLAVNNLYANLQSTQADFLTLFSGQEDYMTKNISQSLEKACKCVQLLCSDSRIKPQQTYSSLIKYRYINLLEIYLSLLENK